MKINYEDKININHEETKSTKVFPVFSSCSSFLLGWFSEEKS